MGSDFKEKYAALQERIKQILTYHTPVDNGRISHFTTWGACLSILSQETTSNALLFRAGDAGCLNDPLESKALLAFTQEVIDSFIQDNQKTRWLETNTSEDYESKLHGRGGPRLEKEEWNKLGNHLSELFSYRNLSERYSSPCGASPSRRFFLSSFSLCTDRLDMWRAYGDQGKGVCLSMPLKSAMTFLKGSNWQFYKVAYDEASKARACCLLYRPLHEAIEAAHDNKEQIDDIKKSLHILLHLLKHEQFSVEQEVRLVYEEKPDSTQPIYDIENLRTYINTPEFFFSSACPSSTEENIIILGPCFEKRDRSIALIEAILLKKKIKASIQLSGAPYQ